MNQPLILPVLAYLAGAIFAGWMAYQIGYKDRIELILFGSAPLPGGQMLKGQFASLPAFLALVCLACAAIIMFIGSIFASWLLFLFAFIAVAVRRGMLVKAIELHSQA